MTRVRVLVTDVGRGHPFYVDGLVEALHEAGHGELLDAQATVFEVARDASLAAWHAARLVYRVAGRGGAVARAYGALREARSPDARRARESTGPSAATRWLGARGLRAWARSAPVVLVDHPLLVAALAGHPGLVYQHGELVAPSPWLARGAARVLVPTDDVARAFVAAGMAAERLVVTGPCVELPFAREARALAEERLGRLASGDPLTVALFSSGAEPAAHVAAIARAARSLVARGHRAVAFASRGGALDRAASEVAGVELVRFTGRADVDRATRERFASFDAFVSPPHERSQWAYALALPMYLVGPDIGPFAPKNRALLLAAGAARDLGDPDAFGARLAPTAAGRGDLLAMASRPIAPHVEGFSRAAAALVEFARGA